MAAAPGALRSRPAAADAAAAREAKEAVSPTPTLASAKPPPGQQQQPSQHRTPPFAAGDTPAATPAAASQGGAHGSGPGARSSGSGNNPLTPAAASRSLTVRVLVGALSLLAWMVCSSALIILNKALYMRGFHYPSSVTGMGQLFSAASGLLLAACGAQRLRPPPRPREFATRVLPVVLSTATTMYFGNTAYLYLSVSFIQILKAFTPALTLLLCVAAGLERPAWPLAVSVLLIAGGTASAVVVESGAPSFQAVGFAAFMASSATEAMRVVGAEVLQASDKYNTAEALLYVGGPTAALLLLAGAALEGPRMATSGALAAALAAPWPFLVAFVMSALVNMTCFLAIQTSSSLTFKVAGCVKNVAVVWYGLVAHGEHVTASQMGGYAVSVLGFALYSRLKMAAAATAAAAAGQQGPAAAAAAGSKKRR